MDWGEWNGSVVISFRTFSVWREPDEEEFGPPGRICEIKGAPSLPSHRILCHRGGIHSLRGRMLGRLGKNRQNGKQMPVCRRAAELSEGLWLDSCRWETTERKRFPLLCIDPFRSFLPLQAKRLWDQGKWPIEYPGVHHPQKDAGLILCTHWADMCEGKVCVMVWGPVLGAVGPVLVCSWIRAPESICLHCFCYCHQLRWQELWVTRGRGGTHSSNTFVWLYLVWMTKHKVWESEQVNKKAVSAPLGGKCSNTENPASEGTLPHILFREITFLCAALTASKCALFTSLKLAPKNPNHEASFL